MMYMTVEESTSHAGTSLEKGELMFPLGALMPTNARG